MKAKLQILFLALGLTALGIPSVHAGGKGNANPGILPPQAAFKGKTAGEWIAAWWTWVITSPGAAQMFDGTGEFAHINNNGADGLFFLAKSWAGVPQTRHVTIPAGTAIFIPINGINWGGTAAQWATLPGDTDQEKVDQFKGIYLPQLHGNAVSIDGTEVKGLEDGNLHYLNETGVLAPYYSPDGSVLVPVFYAFEWSLIVPHLKPGQHVIRMQGSFGQLSSDVTYHLTVLPKQLPKNGRNHHDDDDGDDDGKSK